MSEFSAELIGTMFLILLGNGVVANVVLKGTKGNNAGWMVITTGWALAVFVGVVIATPYSGAHLNPAFTGRDPRRQILENALRRRPLIRHPSRSNADQVYELKPAPLSTISDRRRRSCHTAQATATAVTSGDSGPFARREGADASGGRLGPRR